MLIEIQSLECLQTNNISASMKASVGEENEASDTQLNWLENDWDVDKNRARGCNEAWHETFQFGFDVTNIIT